VLVELPFLQNDLLAFTALQLFFVRRLSFSDIIVATALCRPPVMFLRHIHNLNMGLGVHNLVGCSDRTLAVINQGAELDAWKAQKRSMGELSIGDLYKKGTRILMQLWDGGGMAEGIGPIITEIYRCSTVIYLNVVMSGNILQNTITYSGAFSGINEVKKAIPYLVESVKLLLPHTDALRLLCWPILVGTAPP
jgi:Fungal specific transcription factor domain